MKREAILLVALAAVPMIGAGCKKSGEAPSAKPTKASAVGPTSTPAPSLTKGKELYTSNCLACHGPDPSIDGPVGPAITGSSLELVEARVMRVEYPPGYKPKRNTQAMAPLPYLAENLADIHAYLNSPDVQHAAPSAVSAAAAPKTI